jgi:2-polyprenyl-3-methyl-5-hydroxy-6-metoxy-1,4-benzoquinol methylase
MRVNFTGHNIRLDDGTLTKPDNPHSMDVDPWFLSAKRLIETVFPGDKRQLRLADLGCLEGGYAVEFARMGMQVLGVEVRESNLVACNYVKERTNLPNLSFVKDNALNISHHGSFDIMFCSGLLYHLDKPRHFLETLSACTSKLLIVQTHFASTKQQNKFRLSPICENEGLLGRWYQEFSNEELFQQREGAKWSSWDNKQSFWVLREHLLKAIHAVGFDLVLEQFDNLGPDIAVNMLDGYYMTDDRGTFIGIKTR